MCCMPDFVASSSSHLNGYQDYSWCLYFAEHLHVCEETTVVSLPDFVSFEYLLSPLMKCRVALTDRPLPRICRVRQVWSTRATSRSGSARSTTPTPASTCTSTRASTGRRGRRATGSAAQTYSRSSRRSVRVVLVGRRRRSRRRRRRPVFLREAAESAV